MRVYHVQDIQCFDDWSNLLGFPLSSNMVYVTPDFWIEHMVEINCIQFAAALRSREQGGKS